MPTHDNYTPTGIGLNPTLRCQLRDPHLASVANGEAPTERSRLGGVCAAPTTAQRTRPRQQ